MIIYRGKSYAGLASLEGSSVLQAMPEVTVAMLWTVLICYIEQVSEAPLPEFHGVSYLAAFMLTMRTGIAYKRYMLGAESLNEMECESPPGARSCRSPCLPANPLLPRPRPSRPAGRHNLAPPEQSECWTSCGTCAACCTHRRPRISNRRSVGSCSSASFPW